MILRVFHRASLSNPLHSKADRYGTPVPAYDEMYEFFDSIGVPRTTEEMWADTAKNFPFCSDGMVSFGRAIRLNQMSTFTDDFEKLTGQKPITVREMFEDMENHLIGTRTSTDN